MTAAELKVMREFLGLTTAWLAEHLGVAERTVHRWEAGTSIVPDGVRLGVEELETAAALVVGGIIDGYEDMRDPTETPLVTYRTDADYQQHHPDNPMLASWHRAVCARVAQEVPGLTIIFSD